MELPTTPTQARGSLLQAKTRQIFLHCRTSIPMCFHKTSSTVTTVRIDSFSPCEAEINIRSTTLRIIWVCCSPLPIVSPDRSFSTVNQQGGPNGRFSTICHHCRHSAPSSHPTKKCFFFPHLVNSLQMADEITDQFPRPKLVGLGIGMH